MLYTLVVAHSMEMAFFIKFFFGGGSTLLRERGYRSKSKILSHNNSPPKGVAGVALAIVGAVGVALLIVGEAGAALVGVGETRRRCLLLLWNSFQ